MSEWKLRAVAIPAAIALAFGFHAWPLAHWVQRTFLSMMVHEMGHAVTGWLCGFAAIPTVWQTMIPETRSAILALVVLGLELALIRYGRATRKLRWMVAGVTLIVLQLIGSVGLSVERAQEATTFGGDAGAMILSTLLILTFFVGRDSRMLTNQLRWGFLVIGAAGLVDPFATWLTARANIDAVPFANIAGVGLSDASKLEAVYGWTPHQLVDHHVHVGIACFAVLAIAWLYFTCSARIRSPVRPMGRVA